ncbi:unnamed protein product [Pelagomonas calceolata]|jgi:hypothetical protein|uniref:F-box domain-containing protein n=1 Tax=Pelagomonas calceolata TaxID=35677 RepID=A0A7S3ZMP0_9STRA|nr:unnamed protein product [Pelagomonas calceolata]
MTVSKAFNLLRPELILRIAQYADWRTVTRLQSVCCRCRSALADDGNHHQRIVWRQCVCERWPWVQYEDIDASWLATFRTWRRVYAYLRSVRFVPSAAQVTGFYSSPEFYRRLHIIPKERARFIKQPVVTRTPALRAWRHGGDITGGPMALVEECALADEPLAEPRPGDLSECPVTLASLRPGIVAGPAVWEAMVTVYTRNDENGYGALIQGGVGGFLLGVETLAGDRWFFDVGAGDGLADESAYGYGQTLSARRKWVNPEAVYEWNNYSPFTGPEWAPNQLHLTLNLGAGELVLSHKSQFKTLLERVATLHDPDLAVAAAAGPLCLFVGLSGGTREEEWSPEENFGEEPTPLGRAWKNWSGEQPQTYGDLAYATLDWLSLRDPGKPLRRTPLGRPSLPYGTISRRRIPSPFPLFPQFLPKLT